MAGAKEKPELQRWEMVVRQLRGRGITNQAVLDAMGDVPRELFVPPERLSEAYGDYPLPIGMGQTISQPYIVALSLQELDPRPENRVLEIGAGSGYQTAILSRLVRHIYATERIDELTERAIAALAAINVANVTLATRDGSLGWPEEAPFDRIISAAAAPAVPRPWLSQLVDGGRIVMPIGPEGGQTLVVIEKNGGRITQRELCGVRFVRLIGQAGWEE